MSSMESKTKEELSHRKDEIQTIGTALGAEGIQLPEPLQEEYWQIQSELARRSERSPDRPKA